VALGLNYEQKYKQEKVDILNRARKSCLVTNH